MNALATTVVAIYRATGTNAFGDETDTNTTPIKSGVPASILEQRRQTTRRTDDRAQTVLYFTGRLPFGTDVRASDRLKDSAGTTYQVTAVSTVANPISANDVRVDLERVPTA